MTTRSRKHHIAPAEQLELRILPTVKVRFNPNSGLLKITGDNAANNVAVEGLAGNDGHVEVFVDTVSVGEFENVVSIKANLKGGDDQLFFAAFQIAGNVTVNMGNGGDELDIDDTASTITEQVLISGSLNVKFGGDPGDNADFDDAIKIDKDLTITGVADVDFDGDGTTFEIQSNDDIYILGNLNIQFSGRGDADGDNLELDFDNVAVLGDVSLVGTNSVERFKFTQSFFLSGFTADMNDGNDSINMNNGAALKNLFGGPTIFNGGDDFDNFFMGINNIFVQPAQINDFETIA